MIKDTGMLQHTLTYRSIMSVTDWGAAVTKLIICLGQSVTAENIDQDTFIISSVRTDALTGAALTNETCTVTHAHVSDETGKPQYCDNYITLHLEIDPSITANFPFIYDPSSKLNHWVNIEFTISQHKSFATKSGMISGLTITQSMGNRIENTEKFSISSYTHSSDNITLKYASYTPAKDNQQKPLIIWLHGKGEGGRDGLLQVSANKSCNFASPEIQSIFNGVYVLVPQCPDGWGIIDNESPLNGTTIYEDSLMTLIKNFISMNTDIDIKRIYIGGYSLGGYMTMLLARDFSNYFAAAFPTCEGLRDSYIKDSDLHNLKNIPIWFTCGETDPIFPPAHYSVATYNRLVTAGHDNVHISNFSSVIDTTGQYKNTDGSAYDFGGHSSWIYVYNNQCNDIIDGNKISLMEWLSKQQLQ
ncbi:peptidase [Paenibacillus sp. FSL R10-2791]|uniref:prolyl oligopeptidase family serine peptidase n=1 Tax=Paenibacillus sp. FSL R10-2791 TaxID=2954695 RepID=UPI0030FC2569